MQLSQTLRPFLARPRSGNVILPGKPPEFSITCVRPSRHFSLGRPRSCTTPRWVIFATSRGVKESSAQSKDTCIIATSVENSNLLITSEVETPLDGAVSSGRSSYTTMVPPGSDGSNRSGLYLKLRCSHSDVAALTRARPGSTGVLRCYGWRHSVSLPGGTRLRIVSHVLPPSGGSNISPAAEGGIPAGSPGEHGTRSREESFGVGRGCSDNPSGSSSSCSAIHSGDHTITLSPEHILRVSEAYVEAWWRGVARGAAAAEEELKQLVVTASAAGVEADGGVGGSVAGTVSSAVSVISGTASMGDVAVEQHPHSHHQEYAKELHRDPHSPLQHPHRRHQRKDRLHRQHLHEDREHHLHQEVLSLMPDGVLHKRPLRGYDALVGQLTAQHAEYHRVQYRPITSAASVSTSCGYVLGEYRMQDVGGLAGHPATFRVSRGYCLFKLRLDPVNGRICRGWVRRQMTQEERDERVWDPVHVYPAPFPLERLHLTRDAKPDPRIMEEAACAWVSAQAKPPPPLLKKPATATSAPLHAQQHVPTDFAGYSEWRASGASEGAYSRSGLQMQPLNDVAGFGAKMNGKVTREREGFHGAVGPLATARNGPEEKSGEVGTAAGGDAVLAAEKAAVDIDAVGLEEEAQEVRSLDAAAESRSSPKSPPAGAVDSGAEGAQVDEGNEAAAGAGRLQSISTGGFISSTSPEVFSGGVAVTANEGGGEGGADANALMPVDVNTAAISAGATAEVGRRAAEEAHKLAPAAESPNPAFEAPDASSVAETEAAALLHDVKGVADITPAQARLVEQVLAPDCRLLDAYGIWPDLDDEDGAYGGMYGGRRPQAVVGTQQVLHRIQAQHLQCAQVEPWLYDVAVSEYHNLAFVHWVNIVTPAQDSPAPKTFQRLQKPSSALSFKASTAGSTTDATRGLQGNGSAVRGAGFAVAASSAATAAATAATAAAQAATAAADVATTAASAATMAATAATAAAFAVGPGDEQPQQPVAEAALTESPSARKAPQLHSAPPQQERPASIETASAVSGDGIRREEPKILPKIATADVNGSGAGSRPLGLQDLRIPMPSMPNIPQITQIPIQIQNLEEALSAAAQRVAGAAGTAAAAASAAAAAATAVIMAEAGGSPGTPDAAAAAAARAAVAAQQRRKEAAMPAPPPPPPPSPPVPYQQECMAALLFHDDGTVSDVWTFRGPFHYERRLLKS